MLSSSKFLIFCCMLLTLEPAVFPTNNRDERLCSVEESTVITGSMINQGESFESDDGILYKSGEFWLGKEPRTYHGCVCLHKPCIRKCCPRNKVVTYYSDEDIVCGEVTELWTFDNLDIYSSKDAIDKEVLELIPKNISKSKLGALVGLPCKYGIFAIDDFKILDDGGIFEEFQNSDYSYSRSIHVNSKYCLDYTNVTESDDEPSKLLLRAQICIDEGGNGLDNSFRLYPIFMAINSVFLLLTLFVYCSLDKLRNVMGKSLVSFIICLLVGYAFLFYDRVVEFKEYFLCKTIAFTIYFSLMASFFWLNVMCYDIYSAFKDMQTVQKKKGQKKFVMYSIYAWGSPTIMLIITFVMDTKLVPNFIPKPQMAVSSCFFASSTPLYIYFYIPMMILLGANIYFFTVTIYKLMLVSKQTEVLRTAESKRHHDKEKKRCILYGKLFIVMGVTWIMEVVSELIGGADYYWYLTDIINICQGISIFVIFVLKRRVLYMLNMKFCPSMNLIDISESTSSKPTNSTISSAHGNAQNGAATNENAGNDYEMEASTGIRREGCINPIPLSVITSEEGSSNVSGYAQSPNKERF